MGIEINHDDSALHQLARRIESDIRTLGLRPGDRYVTAEKAGRMLGVSAATANRAMKFMADRDLLVRYRNRGTFVGAAMKSRVAPPTIRTVHLLLDERDQEGFGETYSDLVAAIRREIEGINIQFTFVPDRDGVQYVREVVETAQVTDQIEGIVAVSCSREVYGFLADSGVPTVVFGSLYAGQQDSLPSVAGDGHTAGRLMTQYLIDRGHRRIALITEAQARPGDDHFVDGISEALTERKLPHNALILRRCPSEIAAYIAQARALLEMPDRPTAIIVRAQRLAHAVEIAAEQLELSVPGDVAVVTQSDRRGDKPPAYPHVQHAIDSEEIAELIAGMLNRICRGLALQDNKVVIEVEFRSDGLDENDAQKTGGATTALPAGGR